MGDEAAERLGRKLGIRKLDEKDVIEIFEMVQEDEQLRKDLLKLLERILSGAGSDLGEGERATVRRGLREILEIFPELEERVRKLEEIVGELREEVRDLRREVEGTKREVKELRRVVGKEEVQLTLENLEEELGVTWIKRRRPVISRRLREKVLEIVETVRRALEREERL
ncbi:MAG: hypothetical protein DRO18_05080, partial [Thermoprotei archaeon]